MRKGELLGARWAEFDLEGSTPAGAVWHLPASRTKTGEGVEIRRAGERDTEHVIVVLQEIRGGCGHEFGIRQRGDAVPRWPTLEDLRAGDQRIAQIEAVELFGGSGRRKRSRQNGKHAAHRH